MADISKLRLPNGSEYDLKVYTDHIAPMMSKTFQGVIGTANDFANATFYYGSIRPDDWYQTWGLKYRIKTYVPERNGYVQVADVQLYGDQGALRASSSFNSIGTSCAYYHDLYRLKIAGYNNGYGHALGVSIRSSNNPTNTEYKRTFIIDILETSNCTFTFFDECLKYSSIPGTGSTNYDTYSEINYINQGLQETGDNNDVNYQNRVYYSNPGLKAYAAGGRYTLTFTKDDNYVLPITATDNKYSGEAKVYTTESFNPFGQIYYRYSSSTIAANAQIANASLYRQVMVDARYSFTGVLNGASSVMSANNPVYLVCVPQEDGSAKLAENPLSFELPDSEDGLYYILLGYAYNTYQFELLLNNPVYMFKKGRIREVSNYAHCAGDSTTVDGHTVESDVPSNAEFTDTTYESKTAAQNGTDVSLVTTGEKYLWNSKTSNIGTVTKVTAGTGLSIGTTAGGNFTTSGTINHTNAVTAQNTQAIYPIKIDAQGHISGYGSAVTPLTASSTLDATKLDGTIPTACLPSYVDDVLQYTAKVNFPTTGEAGKIYVDKTTNLTWRWGGSSYVEISPSLALGTTSSTAFRGDYGDAAYAHAVTNKGSAFSSGLYKITTNSEGHVTAATAVQKSDITGLGIPGSNTNTIGEYAGSCIAGPNGIARYSLMMKVDETHWQSLVLSSSTGTTKVKNTSGFIIDSPILYESAGTYTSGAAAGQSACWHTISFDTRYSTNGGQFSTAGKPFYLVGTITNNKFYLANTWWADSLPTTDSDNVYIYIGQMYSKYQCTLQSVHPIYIHKDGKIQEWFSTKHVLISTTQPTNQQPGDYWFVTEEHITLDYQQMPNDYGGNTAYISSTVQEG